MDSFLFFFGTGCPITVFSFGFSAGFHFGWKTRVFFKIFGGELRD
jgi:hypothetical protein